MSTSNSDPKRVKPSLRENPCGRIRDSKYRLRPLTIIDVLRSEGFLTKLLWKLDLIDCGHLRRFHHGFRDTFPLKDFFEILRVLPRESIPFQHLSEQDLETPGSYCKELRIFFGKPREDLPVFSVPGAMLSSDAPPKMYKEDGEEETSDWVRVFHRLPELNTIIMRTKPRSTVSLVTLLHPFSTGLGQATFLKNLTTLRLSTMSVIYIANLCALGPMWKDGNWINGRTWEHIIELECQFHMQKDKGNDTYAMKWEYTLQILQRWLRGFAKNLQTLKWHWITEREGWSEWVGVGRRPHPLFLEMGLPEKIEAPLYWPALATLELGFVESISEEMAGQLTTRAPELRRLVCLQATKDLFWLPVHFGQNSITEAWVEHSVGPSRDVQEEEEPNHRRNASAPATFPAAGSYQDLVPSNPYYDEERIRKQARDGPASIHASIAVTGWESYDPNRQDFGDQQDGDQSYQYSGEYHYQGQHRDQREQEHDREEHQYRQRLEHQLEQRREGLYRSSGSIPRSHPISIPQNQMSPHSRSRGNPYGSPERGDSSGPGSPSGSDYSARPQLTSNNLARLDPGGFRDGDGEIMPRPSDENGSFDDGINLVMSEAPSRRGRERVRRPPKFLENDSPERGPQSPRSDPRQYSNQQSFYSDQDRGFHHHGSLERGPQSPTLGLRQYSNHQLFHRDLEGRIPYRDWHDGGPQSPPSKPRSHPRNQGYQDRNFLAHHQVQATLLPQASWTQQEQQTQFRRPSTPTPEQVIDRMTQMALGQAHTSPHLTAVNSPTSSQLTAVSSPSKRRLFGRIRRGSESTTGDGGDGTREKRSSGRSFIGRFLDNM